MSENNQITAEQMLSMYNAIVTNLKRAQSLLETVSDDLSEVGENGVATRIDVAREILTLSEGPIAVFHQTIMQIARKDPHRDVKSDLVTIAKNLYGT